jgi:hypothetical protein
MDFRAIWYSVANIAAAWLLSYGRMTANERAANEPASALQFSGKLSLVAEIDEHVIQ